MNTGEFLSRGLAVAALVGLAAMPIAACSSDDNTDTGTGDDGVDASTGKDAGKDTGGQSDTGTKDVSQPIDTGTPDTSAPDTSTGDDAGTDTGTDAPSQPDTGTDTGAPDTGTPDAGEPDTGTDTGVPDTGAGDDAGGGTDADTDAADLDAGTTGDADTDAGTTDSGKIVDFAHPVQIDVSAIFNANTIVTTAAGAQNLTPLDGAGNGNDYPTQAEATALKAGSVGYPNDGFFASNGTTIPDVQLAWRDTTHTNNSVLIEDSVGTVFSFDVPAGMYDQIQVYATGGNGSGTLSYTITYASGAPKTGSTALPDWCIPGALSSGTYSLATAHRVTNGTTVDTGIRCGIYAINLNPDATRAVTQVSFSASGNANTYMAFYGATAW